MSERVKVDAGQVEDPDKWLLWSFQGSPTPEWGFWPIPAWSHAPAGAGKSWTVPFAARLCDKGDGRFLVARYIGDPEAVVVSREHPEGVPVEWTGGGE